MSPSNAIQVPKAETLVPDLHCDIIQQAAALLAIASDAGIGIATAESCTGGLLAALLTNIEGGGSAFDRGFIVYSEDSKTDLLGLHPALVEKCGAVSEPVTRAMADGALNRSRAGIAIAITGFAGPGDPEDEPGLVHFACAGEGTEAQHHVRHFGDIGRGPTRIACLREALSIMNTMLSAPADRPQAA